MSNEVAAWHAYKILECWDGVVPRPRNLLIMDGCMVIQHVVDIRSLLLLLLTQGNQGLHPNPEATLNQGVTLNLVATHNQGDTHNQGVTLNLEAIHNQRVTLNLEATSNQEATHNQGATRNQRVKLSLEALLILVVTDRKLRSSPLPSLDELLMSLAISLLFV